ncbi:hypothetical protein PBV87_11790 [Niameybacter massiliensis]|uniref:Uncharacterized protein n=1 Tax=Holtiella tumoricola TaxID=3018743 RepID=A0AA42DNM8_9FIRM|nr:MULTISPECIES: hypothetical protein [Lachnospirales]MDA3732165.1 hypothetical protein [Holtiella tumoricola]
MKRKSIWKLLIVMMTIVCLTTSTLSAAMTSSDIDQNLTKIQEDLKNVQKQLASVLEVIYRNKLENKSSNDSEKILNYTHSELKKEINDLNYLETGKLNSVQSAKLQVLIASANILDYMVTALIDYVQAEESIEQLQLLKVYFKLDTVISQFMIDYDYFKATSY